VRVRTREKLQLVGVVLAGAAVGILIGWVLVQLLILR
jgi:high-affinity Fe2+/Pb2+ permease